jgi:urease accessory protein
MNARIRLLARTSMIAATLLPAMAVAHPGHGIGEHLMAGMLHPLSGMDHVLMIVAVSAWASLLQPAGRFLVAACLALFVAIGALLPMAAVSSRVLEAAIALSVVGSGLLLAYGRRWPLWAAGIVAALFATIHGFAHGVEGPAGSVAYVRGLALATGSLALAVSFLSALVPQRRWLRLVGGAGAVLGTTGMFIA